MTNNNKKKLPNEELAFFAGQVSLMLASGIPVYESMEVLAENYAGTVHAEAFTGIKKATDQGCMLSKAMEESGMFPIYAIKMTAIGEETGKLEQVMRGLSSHYARENSLSIAVRNAVRYPIALLIIMAVVVLILNIKVMPLFGRIMNNLGGSGLSLTRTAMKFGKVTGIVALIAIIILLVLSVALLIMIKRGKKDVPVKLASKVFPFLSRLIKAISAERFLSILSIALSAGYPTETAAEACLDLIDDEASRETVKSIIEKTEKTGSLCDAICESGFLDPLKSRMVKVGFMTGKQEEVTCSVAELYRTETDEKLDKLLSLIEPTLITVLAVIIGCILLAIMLPLAGLMSSML